MSRDDPHFRLRVPANVRDRIADAAKENNRSMNAEIVSRLDASFAPLPVPVSAAIERAHEATSYLEQAKKTADDFNKNATQLMGELENTFKEVQSLAAELRTQLGTSALVPRRKP